MQDADEAGDDHAALAKEFCTSRMRETVAMAREVVGGNGVVLDYGVGRAITGRSAFV